jgi:hypothetical protein
MEELWPIMEFICALEPRNAAVQEYTAWQMAYNFSLVESDPERSWIWVRSSIERLENALEMHPRNPSLNVMLGRIYLEKTGPDAGGVNATRLQMWKGETETVLAARAFEKAFAADRDNVQAGVFLAHCYRLLIDDGGGPELERKLEDLIHEIRTRHPQVYSDLFEKPDTTWE